MSEATSWMEDGWLNLGPGVDGSCDSESHGHLLNDSNKLSGNVSLPKNISCKCQVVSIPWQMQQSEE